MTHPLARWLPPALLIAAAAAAAQPAARTRADPHDPAARTPAATYRSPLADYKRYAEQPVGSWREANETVNRIGGWRAYAREAAQGETPAAPGSPAAAASAPAPAKDRDGHGGHAGHGAQKKD